MPGFIFYLVETERINIIGDLDERGIFEPVIVFNKGYQLYKNIKDMISDVGYEITYIALYSREYSIYDPRIYDINIKGTRIPNRQIGGPMIELDLSHQREIDGKIALGRGSIFHYPSYIDPLTNEYFKTSNSTKQVYNDVLMNIKKLLAKRYCLSKAVHKGKLVDVSHTLWISKSVLPDIEAGKVGVKLPVVGWRSGKDITTFPPI